MRTPRTPVSVREAPEPRPTRRQALKRIAGMSSVVFAGLGLLPVLGCGSSYSSGGYSSGGYSSGGYTSGGYSSTGGYSSYGSCRYTSGFYTNYGYYGSYGSYSSLYYC